MRVNTQYKRIGVDGRRGGHHTRVPDALQRAALLRRAGTQTTWQDMERWAPALQRITEEVLRCVRGTRHENPNRRPDSSGSRA